jgi:hypothetical protein
VGRSKKKKKQQQKSGYTPTKRKPPNQTILDSIGSPNAWTPAVEDAWIEELKGIPAGEIYRRFPPLKKPPSVRQRGSGSGWGDFGV